MSVFESTTADELLSQLVRFCRRLEFSVVSALSVVDRPSGHSEFTTVGNIPENYQSRYHDRRVGAQDPVMQHCKRYNVPIAWDRATYAKLGRTACWERQAESGFHSGISWAMHLPLGRHFVLGVVRDQALTACPGELTRQVACLQLFAVHAQEAVARLLTVSAAPESTQPLTQRELECLRWTLEGKTAWEIGRILHISENTAVRHLYNASHKLDAASKHQAAVRALKLGLIQ